MSLGECLLTPTKIYIELLLPLVQKKLIKGLSRITGGELLENLPRVLPSNLNAQIDSHPPLPGRSSGRRDLRPIIGRRESALVSRGWHGL